MTQSAAEKPRALVAEDDRVLADVIRLALSRAGYDVTLAKDGELAADLARTTRFDVITSDYQMPHLNGEQFLRSVRAGGASEQAVCILCSAKMYELNSERLREELQLAAVLYKPLSLAELVQAAQRGTQLAAAAR